MTIEQACASDEWDNSGGSYYLILPESRIADFFSEERDMLSIDRQYDQWWLSEDGVQGSSPFDALADAKQAGNDRYEEIAAARDERMLAQAGLSAVQWRVAPVDDMDGGLAFDDILGRSIMGMPTRSGPRWTGYDTQGMSITSPSTHPTLQSVVKAMNEHVAHLATTGAMA